MQDRRHDDRFFCADLVEVRWQEGGRDVRRVANLEDISQSGICIIMEKALEPNTSVVVCCGNESFTGVVRHCTFRNDDWMLGIELHVFSQWSADGYRPEHLLDPGDLFPRPVISRS